MALSYDNFTQAFLAKVSEYDFFEIPEEERTTIVDGYMKKAIYLFSNVCVYDLSTTQDDDNRLFNVDIPDYEIYEIEDIISEGMLVQWFKPYLYHQELLQNVLNTRDFTTYSPAEMLLRVGNAYKQAQDNFIQMIREYSYNHGDLTVLHL